MKTRIIALLTALMASASMNAQYVVSDKYDLWFEDTGYEVTTRKPELCTENYQDLRNGCTVRVNSNRVYIYYNGSSFLYGDEINLLYNGYYRVKRSGTWYGQRHLWQAYLLLSLGICDRSAKQRILGCLSLQWTQAGLLFRRITHDLSRRLMGRKAWQILVRLRC